MAVDEIPRLPCGRPVDEAWADLDELPDAHEQQCVYCQAARSSLDELHAATQALKLADDSPTGLRPRASLTADIMRVARAEVRRSRRIPVDHPTGRPEEGLAGAHGAALAISEQAVATVIRRVADSSGVGVEARRCAVDIDLDVSLPDAGTIHPTHLAVRLTVSLPLGPSIPDSVGRLRIEIADAVAERLGLVAGRIDIVVEDVHDPV